MGWFDEQVRERMRGSQEAVEDAFLRMAGAVMGKRLSAALNDQRKSAEDAIADLLRYYHIKAREVPASVKDLDEILELLMRPHGIMRRSVELDVGWYRRAAGPMLGTRRDDGRMVALLPGAFSGYRFFDEKAGTCRRLNRETEKLIDREAVAFYRPLPLKRLGVPDLLRYMREQISGGDIGWILLSSLAVTLTGLLLPRLNAVLFAEVIGTGSGQTLWALTVFLACAAAGKVLFETIRTVLTARISRKLSLSVEAAAMMRLLSLPADFFKGYSAGELAGRTQAVSLLTDQMVNVVFSAGLTCLFSLLYLPQIFLYAPALAAPALCVAFATTALTVLAAVLQTRITREQMELSSKGQGMSYGMISGIQKIRLSGAEKNAFARWGRTAAEEAELLYNPPLFLKISGALNTAVSLAGTLVMYYLAAASGVSVARYYAFFTAYAMVSAAFGSLGDIAQSAALIRSILDMVRPILEAEPEVAEEKRLVDRISGGIELNNVTFRYQESQPPVLENLSLKIRAGQYVAIVGRTGCGKSTLLRILLGFETPQRGAVYYDGKDLKRLDLKSLRRKIGVVLQNGKLFSGDIYSNIVISAPWLNLDAAWEAAETAGIAEDIRAMPMGMFTLVSEGQGGISGGQRQRLMIARAIAPKPKLLMFDEATSALDNLTQKKVSEALDRLKCTRLVIAHRLSTIRSCDRIVVLDHGRIAEDGSYEELIAKKGIFAELVARQQLDADAG